MNMSSVIKNGFLYSALSLTPYMMAITAKIVSQVDGIPMIQHFEN